MGERYYICSFFKNTSPTLAMTFSHSVAFGQPQLFFGFGQCLIARLKAFVAVGDSLVQIQSQKVYVCTDLVSSCRIFCVIFNCKMFMAGIMSTYVFFSTSCN